MRKCENMSKEEILKRYETFVTANTTPIYLQKNVLLAMEEYAQTVLSDESRSRYTLGCDPYKKTTQWHKFWHLFGAYKGRFENHAAFLKASPLKPEDMFEKESEFQSI